MLRNFSSVIFRRLRRSIIFSLEREISGGVKFDDITEHESPILDDDQDPSPHVGRYTPLREPQPAPRRKSRSFLQTYTLSPLVNDSHLLRNLVDVGVKLSKLESTHNVADWLLKLDWDVDVKPRLRFLTETCGVPLQELGDYVSGNPWILQQTTDDLQLRIQYLEKKKFSKEAVARIVDKARYWLNFDVKTIDRRLGYLQTNFELSGDEVRFVVTHSPKIITMGNGYTQLIEFAFVHEMGFNRDEVRQLLIKDPRLFTANKPVLLKTFDYLHNRLQFSHQSILSWPSVLRAPHLLIRQRHEYLKSLNRDQYDPEKANYVSFQALAKCNDQLFVETVAKTTIGEYNKFLKKY